MLPADYLCGFLLAAQGLSDLMSKPLGLLCTIFELSLNFLPDGMQDGLSLHNTASQNPDTIGEQPTVTGRTNVALHHCSICAQLSTARHFAFCGQLDDPLIELLQGFRLDQVCPADQGR